MNNDYVHIATSELKTININFASFFGKPTNKIPANISGYTVDSNGYCAAFPILVGGTDYWKEAVVMRGSPSMAGIVTKGWSHDDSKGGRSIKGVYGGIAGARNKSATGGMEELCVGMEVYQGHGFSVQYNVPYGM